METRVPVALRYAARKAEAATHAHTHVPARCVAPCGVVRAVGVCSTATVATSGGYSAEHVHGAEETSSWLRLWLGLAGSGYARGPWVGNGRAWLVWLVGVLVWSRRWGCWS